MNQALLDTCVALLKQRPDLAHARVADPEGPLGLGANRLVAAVADRFLPDPEAPPDGLAFLGDYRYTNDEGTAPGANLVTPAVLGDLFELVLAGRDGGNRGSSVRVSGGVYYTPPGEIDGMCEQALEMLSEIPAAPAILDPGCGAGNFLVRMAILLRLRFERGALPPASVPDATHSVLHGADLMPEALAVAAFRLKLLAELGNPFAADTRFACGDSLVGLDWQELSLGWLAEPGRGFDVVIGNPPYVRQERIAGTTGVSPAHYKRELAMLAESVIDRFGPGLPASARARLTGRRNDLYVYFFLLGSVLLKPGGVLCLVTSDSWMDTEYGEGLQQFLVHGFERVVVQRDRLRRTGYKADVNTAIVVARSGPGPAHLEFVSHGRDSQTTRVRPRPLGPQAAAGKWAARYLRPGPASRGLIEHPGMVPLGSIAKLAYGNKPGIADFFVLSTDTAAHWRIEPEYLVPFLRSAKEVSSLRVEADRLDKLLFVCGRPLAHLDALGHCGAAGYVRWGAGQTTAGGGKHTLAGVPWPEARSAAGNRPEWHCLSLKHSGQFVIPCLLGNRLFAAWNPEGMAESNTFYHGWFTGLDATVGCALLNGTAGLLALELFGRPKGLGGLNLYGYDLERLPVPSPGLFSAPQREALAQEFEGLACRPVLPATDFAAAAARGALDRIVCEALSLSATHWSDLCSELVEAVTMRSAKGRRRLA